MYGIPKRELQQAQLRKLIGRTVTDVEEVDADEGIRIKFSGGEVLEVGYSGGEGSMSLNGEEIEF